MSDPGVITVTIYGREYSLRTTEDPAYLAELARRVDAQMREAVAGGADSSALRAAVLAALNMADELDQQRRTLDADRARVGARTGKLERMLAEEVGKNHVGGV